MGEKAELNMKIRRRNMKISNKHNLQAPPYIFSIVPLIKTESSWILSQLTPSAKYLTTADKIQARLQRVSPFKKCLCKTFQ